MPASSFLPNQTRVYAIGDTHGMFDLLKQLIDVIIGYDEIFSPKKNTYLVFLGDYIDRGQQSKQLIDYLMTGLPLLFKPIFIKGNHEQMMLDALTEDGLQDFDFWFYNGGQDTISSYNIDLGHDNELIKEKMNQQLRQTGHLDFMQSLETSWTIGHYFFAHAGIRPGVPLAEQKDEELLWIRDRFLNSTKQHEKIIVHGHTPEVPAHYGNRIGIDSGSTQTGRLTAVALEEDGSHQLLTVRV